jgi:hypothetical protein
MDETAFTPSLITELIGFEDFTDEGAPSSCFHGSSIAQKSPLP